MRRGRTDWRRWYARGCSRIRSPRRRCTCLSDVAIRAEDIELDRNVLRCGEEDRERREFHWPRMLQEAVVTLSSEQLNWLLMVTMCGGAASDDPIHARGERFFIYFIDISFGAVHFVGARAEQTPQPCG